MFEYTLTLKVAVGVAALRIFM